MNLSAIIFDVRDFMSVFIGLDLFVNTAVAYLYECNQCMLPGFVRAV